MSSAIRYTCCGTRDGSCVAAPDFIVTTQYVNTDNTGEADYALTCSEHLAANVLFVAGWNAGFPTVEVRAWSAATEMNPRIVAVALACASSFHWAELAVEALDRYDAANYVRAALAATDDTGATDA